MELTEEEKIYASLLYFEEMAGYLFEKRHYFKVSSIVCQKYFQHP
jgi:hypothetical protein